MQYRIILFVTFLCFVPQIAAVTDVGTPEQLWRQDVKPKLNLFEIDGYLRVRTDAWNRLDLGTYNPATGIGTSSVLPSPSGWLLSSNMRLRLDPTLNVSEDIRIRMTVDAMDNLVLGSTRDYVTGLTTPSPWSPYSFLSMSQNAPIVGINNAWGSINLKRVWGEVMTPAGELRFGRMPLNFGIGLLYNAGNHETNDYGDNVDGVMLATRVMGHYLIPGFSMSYTGAYGRAGGFGKNELFVNSETGQRYDFDPSDNVYSFFLTFAKKDKDFDAKILLSEGKTVLNYGVLGSYRFQLYDSMQSDNAAAAKALVKRDAQAGMMSLWGDIRWERLRIEAELVGVLGHVGDSTGLWADPAKKEAFWIMQAGAAMRSRYGFLNDRLVAGLDAGWASGDGQEGFRVRPGFSNPQAGTANFRFNRDYRVDMILFRQIIGTVTNAFYFKPHIGYNFSDSFGIRADAISSFANFASATPGKSQLLGLELDASIFYHSEDGFNVSLQYGFLVPFTGLNHAGLSGNELSNFGTASNASALQLFAGIVF